VRVAGNLKVLGQRERPLLLLWGLTFSVPLFFRLKAVALLGALLVGMGTSEAAEFSARMLLKNAEQVMPGKIYVKDDKLRQEFLDENGHTVTIVRRDKRLVWVVLPWERTYVELPLGLNLPGQFLQIPKDAVSQRRVGTEQLEGYEVERVEVTLRGGTTGILRQTYWVAKKLGLPIKTVCAERRFSVEYTQIREGRQEDRLFEVPPGFKKVTGTLILP
jgi:hypothetical protein